MSKEWVRRTGSAPPIAEVETPANTSDVADQSPYDEFFEEVFSIFHKHNPNGIVRYTKEVTSDLNDFLGHRKDNLDCRYIKCLTSDFLMEGASRGKGWKTRNNIGVRYDGTHFIVGKIEFLRGLDNLGMKFVTETLE